MDVDTALNEINSSENLRPDNDTNERKYSRTLQHELDMQQEKNNHTIRQLGCVGKIIGFDGSAAVNTAFVIIIFTMILVAILVCNKDYEELDKFIGIITTALAYIFGRQGASDK